MQGVPGTAGYETAVEAFAERVDAIDFERLHRPVLHLLPRVPGRVLDVGAGSGRDAAAFAEMGHDVVAVEPSDALRAQAAARHASPRIAWLDDALPALARCAGPFDLAMAHAVWMHLDRREREQAMGRLAALLAPGAPLLIALRHGPVPPGRRMVEVSGDETVALAESLGLLTLLRLDDQPGYFRTPGVSWTRLAFVAPQ